MSSETNKETGVQELESLGLDVSTFTSYTLYGFENISDRDNLAANLEQDCVATLLNQNLRIRNEEVEYGCTFSLLPYRMFEASTLLGQLKSIGMEAINALAQVVLSESHSSTYLSASIKALLRHDVTLGSEIGLIAFQRTDNPSVKGLLLRELLPFQRDLVIAEAFKLTRDRDPFLIGLGLEILILADKRAAALASLGLTKHPEGSIGSTAGLYAHLYHPGHNFQIPKLKQELSDAVSMGLKMLDGESESTILYTAGWLELNRPDLNRCLDFYLQRQV